MSRSQYTSAERGGGRGPTGEMRAAILRQINSWERVTKWADQERADRLFEKVNEAPETFISPNPSANYREESKRIWAELKEEYGLRSETDLSDTHSEWQDRAERHYEKQDRPEPEPAAEPEPADASDSDVRAAVRAAESPTETPGKYRGLIGTVRLYLTWIFLLVRESPEIQGLKRELALFRLNVRYYVARGRAGYRQATGRQISSQ